MWIAFARSLLVAGVLPPEQVSDDARSLGYSLFDFDPQREMFHCVAALACCSALSSFVVPIPVSAGLFVASISALWRIHNAPSMHAEYAYGYIVECGDTYRTMACGSTSDLVQVVEQHFGSLSPSVGSASQWRADWFIIARTLRVLGVADCKVFKAFCEPCPVSNAEGALAELLSDTLSHHELRNPSGGMVEAFFENKPDDLSISKLRRVVEYMNYIHFLWARRELDVLRVALAQAIIAEHARALRISSGFFARIAPHLYTRA